MGKLFSWPIFRLDGGLAAGRLGWIAGLTQAYLSNRNQNGIPDTRSAGPNAMAADEIDWRETPVLGDLPPILLVTMPKSASVFIAEDLATGLQLRKQQISYGYFPYDMVDYRQLAVLLRGNAVSQTHLDASQANIHFLEKGVNRLIVHARDPRQALLSWTHHLNWQYREAPYLLNWAIPTPPKEYFLLPFRQQLSWQIDHYLPQLMSWCSQWVAYSETGNIPVMFTTYEDYVEDRSSFVRKILEFYEIPIDRYTQQHIDKTIELNFRKGDRAEWMTVMDSSQKAQAAAHIPESLAVRFNWSVDLG